MKMPYVDDMIKQTQKFYLKDFKVKWNDVIETIQVASNKGVYSIEYSCTEMHNTVYLMIRDTLLKLGYYVVTKDYVMYVRWEPKNWGLVDVVG